MAFTVKPFDSYTSSYFKNPYNFGKAKANQTVSDLMTAYRKKQNEVEVSGKRSVWDRVGDGLMVGVYTSAGFADGVGKLIRDEEGADWTTPWKQAGSGFLASNMFGQGRPDSEYTYSKVLENAGWKPESTLGKIAKGTVGFVGDVLLDPTTYLSGGVSSLVKGTGRTAKVTSDVAEFASNAKTWEFENRVARLTEQGVSTERATNYATKKMATSSIDTSAKFMTQDMARSFVEYETRKRGSVLDTAKLDADAKEFATKWNELRGIRDVKGAQSVSLGVANLPFGQYIAPKLGVFGKTLESKTMGANLSKFSDATKLSTVYSKTRDALYGSKMGKLFSTNAGAQKLARENPAGLYDLLKFSSYERGLAGDKLVKDKAIRDKAREMNFTEAETKALLHALEDKTILSKVKQTIKISESKKGQEVARNLEKATQELQSKTSDYSDKRTQLDLMKKALETDMQGNRDLYQHMVADYRDYFGKIKLDEISDLNEKAKVVGLIEDEIKSMKSKKENLFAERGFNKEVTESDIIQRVEGLESSIATKIAERDKQFKDIADTKERAPQLAKDANGQERMIGEYEQVAGLEEKYKLIETISEYAFGNKDKLPKKLMDGQVEELTKIIKSGGTPDEVRDYISMNGKAFDPHLAEVYKHVASTLNYKSWDEAYVQPMNKFDEILREGKELSPAQKQSVQNLYNLRERREYEIKRLYDDMTEEEFHATRKALANEKMMNEMRGLLETDDLARARDNFAGDDSHLNFGSKRSFTSDDLMYNDAVLKYANHYGSKLQKEAIKSGSTVQAPHPNLIRAQQEFNAMDERVKQYMAKTGSSILPERMKADWDMYKVALDKARVEYPGNVTRPGTMQTVSSAEIQKGTYANQTDAVEKIGIIQRNMKKVMTEHFPGTEYKKLNASEKAFVMRLATNSKLRKQLAQPKMKKAIQDQAMLKADMNRINTIVDTVKPGHTVYFNKEDGLYKATVEKKSYTEYGTQYQVKLADGTMEEVFARDISRVGSEVPNWKPQERIDNSPVAKFESEETARLESEIGEAMQRLEQAKKEVGEVPEQWKQKKESLVKDFHTKAEQSRSAMKDLEAQHILFRDTLDALDESEDWVKVNADILQSQKVLSDAEALEDYVRLQVGDFETRNIALDEMGNADSLAKITFDSDLDDSAKLREWYAILRKDFDEVGKDELQIGKLSPEQLDYMIGSYLPHIATDAGKEYVAMQKGRKVVQGGITRDLGYGTKFNPFEQSRNLKGDVQAINAHFESVLKGKNMFSTDLSEIYIQRMMKHNELMYDNEYMNTMMKTFGRKVENGVVEEGYKAVINIGHLRQRVDDIVRSRMSTSSNQAKAYDEVTNDVLRGYGFPDDFYNKFATPMVELNADQLSKVQSLGVAYQVSDVIVEKANRARKIKIARDENRFLQVYDKFLHWTKLMQTTVMPHFHIRNKMSNLFQNYLSVGADANNPRMQINAFKAMRAKGETAKLKGLDSIQYVDATGKVAQMGWDELYDMAVVHGVIDSGVFAKDVGAGASSKGLLGKVGVKPKWDVTDTQNFVGFTKGMEVGGFGDNWDRLTQMASHIRQGKTPLEASELVKKYLFDYSDLTGFEQNVMKRILPYYTWLRKNGKLQAQQLIEQPGKYRDLNKVLEGVNGMNNQEDRIDPRYQNGFATDWLQIPQSDADIAEGKKPVILNPFLPYMDLNQIPTQGMDSVRNLASQTAVPLKLPVELLTNRSLFFNSEITDEEATGGENLGAIMRHIAMQVAPTQAVDGLIQKEGEHLGRHAFFLATGVKTLRYDEERAKQEAMYEEMYADQSIAEQTAMGVRRGVEDAIESIAPAFGGQVPDRFAPTPDVSHTRLDLENLVPQLEAKIRTGKYTDADIDQLRSYYMMQEIREDKRHDPDAIDKKIQDIAVW